MVCTALELNWKLTGFLQRVPRGGSQVPLLPLKQQPNLAGVTERQPPVEPQHGSVPILVLPLGKPWHYYQLNPYQGVMMWGANVVFLLSLTVNSPSFLASNRIRLIHTTRYTFQRVCIPMIPFENDGHHLHVYTM